MSKFRSIAFVSAFLMIGLVVVNATAQSVVTAAVVQEAGTAVQSGAGYISLDINNAPLRRAVDEIAQRGDVRVAYGRSVEMSAVRVTLKDQRITVAQALQKVLKGTPLVLTSYEGRLAIVDRKGDRVAQGVIAGRVSDAKSGKGVAGANVSLDADTRRVVTGEDGSYRVAGVSVGSHTVVVRLVGYAKQTHSVVIGEGTTVTVDFKLEPSASVLDQVVVTGTVVSTELKAVPNAITVITAKQIEERGITRIDQLFRGTVPGLFALNQGSNDFALLDEVTMFSRGATALSALSAGTDRGTTPIKTYVDGIEMANSKYLSQIDPKTIERIEILTGPQASTIYGSNALNGVMQIFTKRGSTSRPHITGDLIGGVIQNSFSSSLAPAYDTDGRMSGTDGRWSYNVGGSANYIGPWSPAKNTMRYNASGGGRMDWGKLTSDLSVRRGITSNKLGGSTSQFVTEQRETGLLQPSTTVGTGLVSRNTSILNGQTIGLSLNFSPVSWWSHELVIGGDATNVELREAMARYQGVTDTLIKFSRSNNKKMSERYSTTIQLPAVASVLGTVTFGLDHWRSHSYTMGASGTGLTGTLSTSGSGDGVTRNLPQKNGGSFLQGQMAVKDAVFFTYGLRGEWNPNYGKDAQPNITPRYGVAVTRDVGFVTAKLRASYGRSTRPPADKLKLEVPGFNDGTTTYKTKIAEYGLWNEGLANPDLGPEYQQGGEGGVEMYFSNRGSLIITRYNQTVDALISAVDVVDSVRSILPNPTINNASNLDINGYGYLYQYQYINIGSIRNQGWEVQSSINLGPLVARGTYSWTKSRVIGITPKYRSFFATNSAYQVGRQMSNLPEHTWALSLSYAHAATSLLMTMSGNGQLYNTQDYVRYNVLNTLWHNPNSRLRLTLPSTYRAQSSGYVTMDINGSHKISTLMEGIVQVQNLTNYYRNDVAVDYPSIGRQTKVGVRLNWQ